MKKSVVTTTKMVVGLAIVALWIVLTVAAWKAERWANWRLDYGSRVEDRLEEIEERLQRIEDDLDVPTAADGAAS